MSKEVVRATQAARKELLRQVAQLDKVLATLQPAQATKPRKKRGPNKPRAALGAGLGVLTAVEKVPEQAPVPEREEAPASTVRAVPQPKPRPVPMQKRSVAGGPKGPLARKAGRVLTKGRIPPGAIDAALAGK